MEDSQSSTGKTGLWQRIFDLFFGYDYFIAHRSVDGKPYAAALYDALTTEGNELDCFLDVKHYDAGGRLPWMQSRALKKTSRLIVISTEHAHDPDPITFGERFDNSAATTRTESSSATARAAP
jgi:hypothetical protein